MEYEDRITIATPEGVSLELTLAGVGSRSIAGAIDMALQMLLLLGLYLLSGAALGGTGWHAAIIAVAVFLVIFTYDVAFEVLAAGRTPGKRWTGLRVVREGGRPVGLVTSATRNVLRLVDFLPSFYALAMGVVLVTPRNQRLGDLAAGTLVVRERRAGVPGASPAPAAAAGWAPPVAGGTGWDLSAVSARDVATVREFLARRSSLDPAAADRLAADLAARLRPAVAGAPGHLPPERFLEEVVRRKAGGEDPGPAPTGA